MKYIGRVFLMALVILVVAASQGFSATGYDEYRDAPEEMAEALCIISAEEDVDGLLDIVREDMLLAYAEQVGKAYEVDDIEVALDLTIKTMYVTVEEDPTKSCEVVSLSKATCTEANLDECAIVTLYKIHENGEKQESEIPIFEQNGVWYADIFATL